jgi:predicted nucleic acid-binding protein
VIPVQRAIAGPAVVVDASAMVDVLSGQPSRERLVAIMLDARAALHAPVTLDLELLSAARRLERADRLNATRLREFLADLAEFAVDRHRLPPLMGRVWSLRDWLRVSDGYYVSLAEALGAPLLTTDRRLARAVTDRRLVEVVDIDAG